MDLIVARKQRLGVEELPHDTSSGSEVHRLVIGPLTKQKFRRPVPASGHIVCQVSVLGGPLPGKAEIAELEDTLLADEQILRLDISMDDLLRVHVVNGLDELEYVFSHRLGLSEL